MVSELYDILDVALAHFNGLGGKADTIILPTIDHQRLAGVPDGDRVTRDARGKLHYRGVRVMEGNPFDRGLVHGHDDRKRPSQRQL